MEAGERLILGGLQGHDDQIELWLGFQRCCATMCRNCLDSWRKMLKIARLLGERDDHP